jgi:hypothetical protein
MISRVKTALISMSAAREYEAEFLIRYALKKRFEEAFPGRYGERVNFTKSALYVTGEP